MIGQVAKDAVKQSVASEAERRFASGWREGGLACSPCAALEWGSADVVSGACSVIEWGVARPSFGKDEADLTEEEKDKDARLALSLALSAPPRACVSWSLSKSPRSAMCGRGAVGAESIGGEGGGWRGGRGSISTDDGRVEDRRLGACGPAAEAAGVRQVGGAAEEEAQPAAVVQQGGQARQRLAPGHAHPCPRPCF
eukprot:3941120-Rhodomonas_salina.1